jgi:hypothetical protein
VVSDYWVDHRECFLLICGCFFLQAVFRSKVEVFLTCGLFVIGGFQIGLFLYQQPRIVFRSTCTGGCSSSCNFDFVGDEWSYLHWRFGGNASPGWDRARSLANLVEAVLPRFSSHALIHIGSFCCSTRDQLYLARSDWL